MESSGQTLHNPKLYEVVHALYREVLEGFADRDFNSEEFLASFPYGFLLREQDRRAKVVEAGFDTSLRAEAERAIAAYYSDHGGGDAPDYFCAAIEDFLNYVVPRTAGLPDGDEYFDRFYRRFDECIYGDRCDVTVFGIIEGLSNHSGYSLPTPGYRLRFVSSAPPGGLGHRYMRDRAVPFLEIKKAARPLAGGRDISKEHSIQILEFATRVPKNAEAVNAAYRLKEDVILKFLFAVRLVNFSATYAEHLGFRMPGHLSAFSLNCMNYPDRRLVEMSQGGNFDDGRAIGVSRILSALDRHPSFTRFQLLNDKIEDAMRRQRRSPANEREAQKRCEIDQILDYFQIIEAVLPTAGSEYIALYVANLMRATSNETVSAYDTFKFVKDMYTIRNSVVHGRMDEVLTGKLGKQLDLHRFRSIVYRLVALHVLNGSLRESATRLALGESVALETTFGRDPREWDRLRKEAAAKGSQMHWW